MSKATCTLRADGRVDTIRNADGSLFWSADGGYADPTPAGGEFRCDSADWVLPSPASAIRCDGADVPPGPPRSSAEFKRRLGAVGVQGLRFDARRADDAERGRRAAEERQRRDEEERRRRAAGPPASFRADAKPPGAPVRSSAELKKRIADGLA